MEWKERTVPDGRWMVRFAPCRAPDTGWEPWFVVCGEPDDDMHDPGLFFPGQQIGPFMSIAEADEARSRAQSRSPIHWRGEPDHLFVQELSPTFSSGTPWLSVHLQLTGKERPHLHRSTVERYLDWSYDVSVAISVGYVGSPEWLFDRIKSETDWEWVVRVEGPDVPEIHEEWIRRVETFRNEFGFPADGDLLLD